MVLLILLVLALFVLQTLLPGRFREPVADGASGKLAENLGNHDHMRPLTVVGQRATRALANMHEALPVFLIARVLYVGVYMAGIAVVRTLIWAVSWVGLAMMIAPLLGKI
jgi:uncharacterized MAPEG superfamily protein